MKFDYGFAVLCWTVLIGPTIIVLATGNVWYFLLYIVAALVFGLA